jgi:polysaccharide export outer membrane protein
VDHVRISFRALSALCFAFLVTSCTSLPIQGPRRVEIEQKQTADNQAGFILVDVDRTAAQILLREGKNSLKLRFGKGRSSNSDLLGPGDILNVSIWEADPNGLFSAGNSNAAGSTKGQVSGLEVDRSGYIRFPYIGRIRAGGSSIGRLSERIRYALSKQTTNPQVHIERVKKSANTVTVIGGVKNPGVFPIGSVTNDILDAVATAGGSTNPTFETQISLTRGGKTGKVYLDRIIAKPSENIYLRPKDKISLEKAPRYFLAFGAVSNKGQIDFGQPNLTVLEAIAKARGLDDDRADATGVFLFRFESRKTVQELGRIEDVRTQGNLVPVIYRFDLRDANQYFYAKAINVRSKDALYAANASSVQVSKFLDILGKAVGIGVTTVGSARPYVIK